MAHRRIYQRPAPLIIRRVSETMASANLVAGQSVIGKQTRQLETGDWVLVSEQGQESIQYIQRHQGDLIYFISPTPDDEPRWLHAKYIVAKIIWPKLK